MSEAERPQRPGRGNPTDVSTDTPAMVTETGSGTKTGTEFGNVTETKSENGDDRPSEAPTTVAIVLAAGSGSRFEGPDHKLSATIAGVPVLQRSVAVAVHAAIGPVVVVVGDHTLPPLPSTVTIAHNPRATEGQITSVHRGLQTARDIGADAVVIGLGDQPFVTPEAWRAVAASSAPIAVATYDGRRGNPVRLHASMWDHLPLTGDEGARSLIRMHPDLVEPVPCTGSAADIDTLEDLERWQNRS